MLTEIEYVKSHSSDTFGFRFNRSDSGLIGATLQDPKSDRIFDGGRAKQIEAATID